MQKGGGVKPPPRGSAGVLQFKIYTHRKLHVPELLGLATYDLSKLSDQATGPTTETLPVRSGQGTITVKFGPLERMEPGRLASPTGRCGGL